MLLERIKLHLLRIYNETKEKLSWHNSFFSSTSQWWASESSQSAPFRVAHLVHYCLCLRREKGTKGKDKFGNWESRSMAIIWEQRGREQRRRDNGNLVQVEASFDRRKDRRRGWESFVLITVSVKERRTRKSNCKLLFKNWGPTSVFEWDPYE